MVIRKRHAAIPLVTMAALVLARNFTDDVWPDATNSPAPSPYGTGDPKLAAANLAGGPTNPFLTDGHAVQLALGEIAKHSGKPLRVTSMWADRTDGLTVDVQDSRRHAGVDRYVIAPDGTFAEPQTVRVPSPTESPGSAFDPQAIAFARMTQTVRQAIAMSKFPESRVSAWQVDGVKPGEHLYMYLDSARAHPIAVVDPRFNLVRIQR